MSKTQILRDDEACFDQMRHFVTFFPGLSSKDRATKVLSYSVHVQLYAFLLIVYRLLVVRRRDSKCISLHVR